MNTSEQTITRFRMRLAMLLALKHSLNLVALWLFVWGTLVLVLRAGVGISLQNLLWGLVVIPFALCGGVLWGAWRLPSRRAVRALIDRQSSCGGLLMAEDEVGLGDWHERVAQVESPVIQWRGGRAWARCFVAVCFVVTGFLIPERLVAISAATTFEVGRETAKLSDKIDVLRQESILEPTRAEALQQKLKQVRDEAKGSDPAKTLEALDHVEDFVHKTAQEAAESAARKMEQLSKAESIAEALDKKSADQDLARLTDELTKDDALKQLIDPELANELDSGDVSQETLDQLAKELKGRQQQILKQMRALYKAGLINPDELNQCEKAGECEASLASLIKAGSGAPTRGPGAAPLTFGDESTSEGMKFKAEALTPGSLAALKQSKLTGVSQATPKVDDGNTTQPGALDGAAVGGGSAHTQVVLPQHRGAVDRFFDRPATPTKQ